MIVKVFEDDLAWEVQKRLVNTYFKAKEETINENTIISQLSEVLSSINTRLSKLEEAKEQTLQIETTYKKPYNPWFAKMQPKYKLLEELPDIHYNYKIDIPNNILNAYLSAAYGEGKLFSDRKDKQVKIERRKVALFFGYQLMAKNKRTDETLINSSVRHTVMACY